MVWGHRLQWGSRYPLYARNSSVLLGMPWCALVLLGFPRVAGKWGLFMGMGLCVPPRGAYGRWLSLCRGCGELLGLLLAGFHR